MVNEVNNIWDVRSYVKFIVIITEGRMFGKYVISHMVIRPVDELSQGSKNGGLEDWVG